MRIVVYLNLSVYPCVCVCILHVRITCMHALMCMCVCVRVYVQACVYFSFNLPAYHPHIYACVMYTHEICMYISCVCGRVHVSPTLRNGKKISTTRHPSVASPCTYISEPRLASYVAFSGSCATGYLTGARALSLLLSRSRACKSALSPALCIGRESVCVRACLSVCM